VNSLKFGMVLLAMVSVSACGGEQPPPVTPEPPPPAAEPPPPAAAPPKTDDGSAAQLNIAPDIRRLCGITEAEALFDFDSSKVRSGDHPVLDKLVQCFTTGPLAGKVMRLVGHADPRGDDEYNVALGGRRSANVKNYLVGLKLKDEQAETTSRGEMDAVGTDESGWVKDRRVDIVLAN
jgi:peptidoglycan-associated lipoprotein